MRDKYIRLTAGGVPFYATFMPRDELADFKALLTTHAQIVNVQREALAQRIGAIVAASGSGSLSATDVVVAMARIDTVFDEFYGRDDEIEGSILHNMIVSEADRAEALAQQQSDAIIEEELKDNPELIQFVKNL